MEENIKECVELSKKMGWTIINPGSKYIDDFKICNKDNTIRWCDTCNSWESAENHDGNIYFNSPDLYNLILMETNL